MAFMNVALYVSQVQPQVALLRQILHCVRGLPGRHLPAGPERALGAAVEPFVSPRSLPNFFNLSSHHGMKSDPAFNAHILSKDGVATYASRPKVSNTSRQIVDIATCALRFETDSALVGLH
jgi:hypothetical protein